jgi:hypothetical protein
MIPEAQATVDMTTVYYILGFMIVSNLGVIVTIVIALVKGVYHYAQVASKADALHDRVDRMQDTLERLLSKDD